MNRDDIIRIAKAVGLGEVDDDGDIWCSDGFYTEEIDSFAQFAYDAGRKAEREKVAEWMMARAYATGHGETTEELLEELGWQIEEKIAREREACAKACDKLGDEYADANPADCAFVIRERGAP